MKLGTEIHHVSGHCCKGFKVKGHRGEGQIHVLWWRHRRSPTVQVHHRGWSTKQICSVCGLKILLLLLEALYKNALENATSKTKYAKPQNGTTL